MENSGGDGASTDLDGGKEWDKDNEVGREEWMMTIGDGKAVEALDGSFGKERKFAAGKQASQAARQLQQVRVLAFVFMGVCVCVCLSLSIFLLPTLTNPPLSLSCTHTHTHTHRKRPQSQLQHERSQKTQPCPLHSTQPKQRGVRV